MFGDDDGPSASVRSPLLLRSDVTLSLSAQQACLESILEIAIGSFDSDIDIFQSWYFISVDVTTDRNAGVTLACVCFHFSCFFFAGTNMLKSTLVVDSDCVHTRQALSLMVLTISSHSSQMRTLRNNISSWWRCAW